MTQPSVLTRQSDLLADASAVQMGWDSSQTKKALLPDAQGRNDGQWHQVDLAGGGSIQVRFARWKGNAPVFEAKGQSATIMKLEGFQSFSAAASNAAERTRGGALKAIGSNSAGTAPAANPFQGIANIKVGNQSLGQLTQRGMNAAGQLLQNTPLPLVGVTPKQAVSAYNNAVVPVVNQASSAVGGKPVLSKLPEPVALQTYRGKVYGGTVTAEPLPLSADGRQRWRVQWEGPQGITSLEVQLKGQFGSRHLANGSFTKNSIGEFVKATNQHWAQVERQQQQAQKPLTQTQPQTQPLTPGKPTSPEQQKVWAGQALQQVSALPAPESKPVQLNVLDPRLGLAKGVPKDWFSKGVTGLASGVGNLVGDALGLPQDSPQQKLFAQNRASVALYDLTKANVAVDEQGRFTLPNTQEAGQFYAALVAQSGQAGDPTGSGFGNVQKVGLALDKGLAQQYGLSKEFMQGYKKAQDQMAVSGLINVAQTLSSLAPMMATRLAANRPPSTPPGPRVDVVAGARTEVKPNARPIEIKPLQQPVVNNSPRVQKRLTPNVEFSGDKPPARLPPQNTPTPRGKLPDANTIDVTPISSEVVKPVRTLRSKEMNTAIPNPLSTPINRQAVLPNLPAQNQLRGNGKTAPQLGSNNRLPPSPGGGGNNTPAVVNAKTPRNNAVQTTVPVNNGGNGKPSSSTPVVGSKPQPINKPPVQLDTLPGNVPITPAVPTSGVRGYQLHPGQIGSVPLSQSGQGDVVVNPKPTTSLFEKDRYNADDGNEDGTVGAQRNPNRPDQVNQHREIPDWNTMTPEQKVDTLQQLEQQSLTPSKKVAVRAGSIPDPVEQQLRRLGIDSRTTVKSPSLNPVHLTQTGEIVSGAKVKNLQTGAPGSNDAFLAQMHHLIENHSKATDFAGETIVQLTFPSEKNASSAYAMSFKSEKTQGVHLHIGNPDNPVHRKLYITTGSQPAWVNLGGKGTDLPVTLVNGKRVATPPSQHLDVVKVNFPPHSRFILELSGNEIHGFGGEFIATSMHYTDLADALSVGIPKEAVFSSGKSMSSLTVFIDPTTSIKQIQEIQVDNPLVMHRAKMQDRAALPYPEPMFGRQRNDGDLSPDGIFGARGNPNRLQRFDQPKEIRGSNKLTPEQMGRIQLDSQSPAIVQSTQAAGAQTLLPAPAVQDSPIEHQTQQALQAQTTQIKQVSQTDVRPMSEAQRLVNAENFYQEYGQHLINIGAMVKGSSTDAVSLLTQSIVDLYGGEEKFLQGFKEMGPIAVGFAGGKDSSSIFQLLRWLQLHVQKKYGETFQIRSVTMLQGGLPPSSLRVIDKIFRDAGVIGDANAELIVTSGRKTYEYGQLSQVMDEVRQRDAERLANSASRNHAFNPRENNCDWCNIFMVQGFDLALTPTGWTTPQPLSPLTKELIEARALLTGDSIEEAGLYTPWPVRVARSPKFNEVTPLRAQIKDIKQGYPGYQNLILGIADVLKKFYYQAGSLSDQSFDFRPSTPTEKPVDWFQIYGKGFDYDAGVNKPRLDKYFDFQKRNLALSLTESDCFHPLLGLVWQAKSMAYLSGKGKLGNGIRLNYEQSIETLLKRHYLPLMFQKKIPPFLVQINLERFLPPAAMDQVNALLNQRPTPNALFTQDEIERLNQIVARTPFDPAKIAETTQLVNDMAREIYGYTPENIDFMVASPFANKGENLRAFLAERLPQLRPAQRAAMEQRIREVLEGRRSDPVVEQWLETLSSIKLPQLRLSYTQPIALPFLGTSQEDVRQQLRRSTLPQRIMRQEDPYQSVIRIDDVGRPSSSSGQTNEPVWLFIEGR